MNFLEEITKLKENAKLLTVTATGYRIIKVTVSTPKGIGHRYYAMNRNEILGAGSFGKVYKAYPINTVTGEMLTSKPYAVKVFKDATKFNSLEASIFKRYYKAEEPVKEGSRVYFVTEYFPGQDLFNDEYKLQPEFNNLSFGQTLELINQICIAINLIHHNTPSTGSALSHADIKGENIKVYINPDNGSINVYLFDFGLSDEIEDNPNVKQKNGAKGSNLYVPLEAYVSDERGIKSDIYALVPIIAALLGGNPFYNKMVASIVSNAADVYKEKYELSNILTKFANDVSKIKLPLARIITDFLESMQSSYDTRPDSDEVLKFSTALNNYYKTHQKMLKTSDLFAFKDLQSNLLGFGVTMVLIATGLWQKKDYESFMTDETYNAKVIELYSNKQLNRANLTSLQESIRVNDKVSNFAETISQKSSQSSLLSHSFFRSNTQDNFIMRGKVEDHSDASCTDKEIEQYESRFNLMNHDLIIPKVSCLS